MDVGMSLEQACEGGLWFSDSSGVRLTGLALKPLRVRSV